MQNVKIITYSRTEIGLVSQPNFNSRWIVVKLSTLLMLTMDYSSQFQMKMFQRNYFNEERFRVHSAMDWKRLGNNFPNDYQLM